MPACLTHYQFAKRVLERLPQGLVTAETEYYWGAQGPDFLFAHRFFFWMKKPGLREYGTRLHVTDPVPVLAAVRDFLSRHPDPAYRSYACGMACHYALDSTAHPFVQARAAAMVARRPEEDQGTMHGEIEGALDAIVLRRETGQLPSEVSLASCFPKNEATQRRIAKLYRDVISQALGDEVSEEELFQATKDAHLAFAFLTDRSGLKQRLVERVERGKAHRLSSHFVPLTENGEEDYLNLAHDRWDWHGLAGEEDFFQLFDEAIELALGLIPELEQADDARLAELTGNRSFAGEIIKSFEK